MSDIRYSKIFWGRKQSIINHTPTHRIVRFIITITILSCNEEKIRSCTKSIYSSRTNMESELNWFRLSENCDFLKGGVFMFRKIMRNKKLISSSFPTLMYKENNSYSKSWCFSYFLESKDIQNQILNSVHENKYIILFGSLFAFFLFFSVLTFYF